MSRLFNSHFIIRIIIPPYGSGILNDHHISIFSVSFGCVYVFVLQRCIKCIVNGAENETWEVG